MNELVPSLTKITASEAVFLVTLRMSSFPAGHELQGLIIEKLVPS